MTEGALHRFGEASSDFMTPPSPESPVPDAEIAGSCLEARQTQNLCRVGVLDTAHDFLLDDEQVDALDAVCVPDELLEDWNVHEAKMMMSPCAGNRPALPPLARDMALRFMAHIAKLLNLHPSAWFHLAVLLDGYCQRHSQADMISRLPATCVALVKMLKKADAAGLSMKGSNLSAHAGQLREWLQSIGIWTDSTTEEMLNEQEASVLATLEWKIFIPSIESWLSTYCTRFSVLTQWLLGPSLSWVWETTISNGRILVMHSPASALLPPGRQAKGLLGMACVSARLLPLDAIRPEKVSPLLWEQLFLQIQGALSQQAAVPVCVMRDDHAMRILKLLCMSVGTDLENLQHDCGDVALQLRNVLTPPGSSQQGGQPSE